MGRLARRNRRAARRTIQEVKNTTEQPKQDSRAKLNKWFEEVDKILNETKGQQAQ